MIKVGLLGIGLNTYWKQFEELLEHLQVHQQMINHRISSFGVTVINVGMVDSPVKAVEVGSCLKSCDIEMLFLYVSTYALSSTVLPIIQRLKVPVVMLNLQPVASLDYDVFNNIEDKGKMTGIWLEHCQACAVPEITSVFNRAGIRYDIITGYLDDPEVWNEIGSWVDAVKVAYTIRNTRLGILGHYYCGMLDVYSDITKLSSIFGTHMEILEMCEMKKYIEEIKDVEIAGKIQEFNNAFEVDELCSIEEIKRAAHTSLALDRLVKVHDLGALAFYYEGADGNDYENIVTSVIAGNTLLTGRNIPVAGECDIKNVLAMKIMSALNAGGSFSEFYLIDYKEDVVFLGHDGPAHFVIADSKVGLVPLPIYHGKPGKGLSIQMSVKQGPVTLLSIVEGKDDVFFLVAEGESVEGATLKIGNTNSRYKFSIGAKKFMNAWSKQGPAHHCAIGIGHCANKISLLGDIIGIRTIKIC